MKGLIQILVLLVGLLVASHSFVFAQMSSSNYRIVADSVNTGGSEDANSANYNLVDTLGEIGTGHLNSANYNLWAGFRNIDGDQHSLRFSISVNNLVLAPNPLTSADVSTASNTVEVTTNARDGYFTTIIEDHDFKTLNGNNIDDVADGEVTAGSEEYGIRTSGADGQMNGADTAITATPQTVASSNSEVSASQTVINYKAAINGLTAAGDYSHVVTFVTTGNF